MPAILITGGAGYIGSHTAYYCAQQGSKVIVLDNLMHGTYHLQDGVCLYKGDYADTAMLDFLFSTYSIEAVMHFAAFIQVGESIYDPLKYYVNNVAKTIQLLEVMLKHGVKTFVFSSTAAVYGIPQRAFLDEDHPKDPVNPYGSGKLMVERILQDFSRAYGLSYVGLRYFNAAGACPEYGLGERHNPESHLIPLLLRACTQGIPFTVFGTDYPTFDGTCVRDYVHVLDIARAHYAALSYLKEGNPSDFFNLGMGKGFSVRQVIETVERVVGAALTVVAGERRLGDPAELVADIQKARKLLQWEPFYTNLDDLVRSAQEFEQIKNHDADNM